MKAEVGHLGLCHPVLWVWDAAAPVPSGSGKDLLAHGSSVGEAGNPLMLPPFCLGHVPTSLARSSRNWELGPVKNSMAPLDTRGWNRQAGACYSL